ncbi:hypothetical protein Celaphus_00013244, partial [Cervus elaphus hippelaphus]
WPCSGHARAHVGGGVLVQLADLAHEQQVLLLLLELGHGLLAALQLLLRPRQLLTQPLVLLHQAPHLGPQLLLLRLHSPQVARERQDHLYLPDPTIRLQGTGSSFHADSVTTLPGFLWKAPSLP